MRPKVKVILVDASGSMRPAWDAAWETVFAEAESHRGSFSILAFKERLTIPERLKLIEVGEKGRKPILVERPGLAVIDVAGVIAAGGRGVLEKRPEPEQVGVVFSGRTPLNDAIVATLELVSEELPDASVELVVVSDNRDTASRARLQDVINARRRARNVEKVTLVCVGNCNRKYLEAYDEVIA